MKDLIKLVGGVATGVAIFIVISLALSALNNAPRPAPVTSVPAQMMTLNPQIIANLTALPQATPLSGEDAADYEALKAALDACADYTPQRRSQMEQHIIWLLDPSTIPMDIMVAMGADPAERLIFGMATYTSIEYRSRGPNTDSCLLPIGRTLNGMLAARGTTTFDTFE